MGGEGGGRRVSVIPEHTLLRTLCDTLVCEISKRLLTGHEASVLPAKAVFCSPFPNS